MRIMLWILLSICLVVSSAITPEEMKVFCNESILKEMWYISRTTPEQFEKAHHKCMEKKDKQKFKEARIQCEERYITVDANLIHAVRYPMEFAACIGFVMRDLNVRKGATKYEYETILEMQARATKLHKVIQEIQRSNNTSIYET
ncbi:hypothetical protein TNCT_79821 [Trichonephila clavata]|uniref:Uncharacterized protein n=1 Tax=Trichonephila clavata TaxID=2740835 RepID=A0A8X6JHY9_TRICU|nr:hypothetical protein TNCT_79821 [Trichonephila clavata]